METALRTKGNEYKNLVTLRKKVTTLAILSEDEALLSDVVAMFSGVKRPCTYTPKELASVLAEADEDYKAGNIISHEQLFAEYGL